ncbi:unnamed protein product [Polarella glacialis]|uniref:Amidase domain-containing protein n=1 Tax=Polarella glacialis TaxID=89957 RepID=A0A813E7F4_POLGL|nr:unnamed protein product [Polarella glacialis]
MGRFSAMTLAVGQGPTHRLVTVTAQAGLALVLLGRLSRWLWRYRWTRPLALPLGPAFLHWSASKLAEAIRQGQLRASDVVQAYIATLSAADKKLNIVATERFAAAQQEALEVDKRVAVARSLGQAAIDALPAFLGVPIISKESFEYTGLQYTNGLLCRKGLLGLQKGPVIRRMEEAGFIVLGGGNLSEACMWMESYNPVYGRTSSPFGLHLTPGGSSGGTAAGVASLGAPVGITSDIGGSTRIPSLYNGLFGHKATGGLVPNTRTHLDNYHGAVCRICQPGMVARHAEDLLPMLKHMAGPPDPIDNDPLTSEYLPIPKWLDLEVDFSGLTVGSLSFCGGFPTCFQELLLSSVSVGQLSAQAKVVEWLQAKGCHVKQLYFEDLAVGHWFATWATRVQAAGGPTFREVICQSKNTFGLGEIFRYILGVSPYTLPALGLAYAEDLQNAVEPPLEKRLEKAAEVEQLLTQALQTCNILVMPILPRHGCVHDELLFRILDSSFISIWNAVEFPSTAVPVGLHRGLPTGVQIVSSKGQDELTIGVAVELSRAGVARCVPPGSGS